MSTPSILPGGYPDFGRVELATSTPFVDIETGQAFVDGAFTPTLYTGAYPSLLVAHQAGAVNVGGLIDFYRDAAGLDPLSAYSWSLLAGDTGIFAVTAATPYFSFTPVVNGGGTRTDVQCTILGLNSAVRPAFFDCDPRMVSSTLASVGAASTTTVDSVIVVPGLAKFRWATTATVWQITVLAVDETGTTSVVWSCQSSLGFPTNGELDLVLPAQHIRIQMTNTDAAAKSFRVGLETTY